MPRVPSSGPIPITGVSEVVLEVVDLARALRFYAEVLGLPVISRREDGERAWLMAGTGTRIGLWRPQVGIAGGRGGVHLHYAFHLDDSAYDDAVARLRSFGHEPEEHSFDDQGRAAYVDDPDRKSQTSILVTAARTSRLIVRAYNGGLIRANSRQIHERGMRLP